MALSGLKKKKDAAPDAPGGAPAPAKPAKVAKERKAKPPKAALKNGTVVGLNIGNAQIKAVEVSAKNGELSVSRLASVPTPPDAYQNGNVLSVSALSGALKALWKTGGFKGKSVISSVSGTGALVVRVIEVPTMTDAQLTDAMRADAQLYIPFPPTEVQMDFKALRELPTDPDAGTMDVLLAAAQSEIIDLHVKTIQGAKLDPRAIDVEPIAAGRALSLAKRGAGVDYNEISAIANIGAFGTEISLLRGDVLVFTRAVSTGGNTMSQSIADTLGVPLVEGERLKIEQGDALPPEGYQSGGATAGDDFDFGGGADLGGVDFGGNDFDDFGLNSASSAPPGATTVLDAPDQPASTDPFDLDFFNQGPKKEPGAGHGQKEGQPNPGGGFSFDDVSLLPAPDASESSTPATPASQGANFNFDFDSSPQDLPSTAPEVAPSAPAPSTPTSSASTPNFSSFDFGGDALSTGVLPEVQTPPSASSAVPKASISMPSAFDFSDFDLPASSAGAAPLPGEPPIGPSSSATQLSSTPAPSPEPSISASSSPTEFNDFAFGDAPASAPAPAPMSFADAAPAIGTASGLSLDKPAEAPTSPAPDPFASGLSFDDPAPVVGATPPSESTGFDMNDIFGETPTAPGAVETSPVAVDAGLGGLDLGAVGGDDTGFGMGQTGDDFGGFGAGLSGGVDAGGAALYDALSVPLEELAGEISRSLSFYLERVPDAALSRIYITGGGALLRNLDVFLTQRLGAPTSVFNPLQTLPVLAPTDAAAQGPLYTVALGLALRDFVD